MTPPTSSAETLSVRVPASTSNLGPGFDVLGMAVDLFLEAEYHRGSGTLRMEHQGEVGGPPLEEDAVLRAFYETATGKPWSDNALGHDDLSRLPGGVLHVRSDIPLGRGLGSSAAATVAGHLLGLLLQGQDPVPTEVLAWVSAREGHPDNAAPAILGGLVASRITQDGSVWTRRFPVSDRLGWVYAAPGAALDTPSARAALPDRVSLQEAVGGSARLLHLLDALEHGDGPALRDAVADTLHVPARLPLIPGGADAVAAGYDAGAWAVTISGAGSGLIAVTPPDAVDRVGEAMGAVFRKLPDAQGGFLRVLRPVLKGAHWSTGASSTPAPRTTR